QINEVLRTKLDEVTQRWGVKVTTVEIRELTPPRDVQEAMNRQLTAERTRRASVTEAEGKRASAILVAEGDKQSNILQAEGPREPPSLRDGDPSRAGALGDRGSASQRGGGGSALIAPARAFIFYLLRNGRGDPRRALATEPPRALGAAGTAIGPDRRRGASGEYTRGGIRQADAAGAWRVGRAARTANAFITAICVLP